MTDTRTLTIGKAMTVSMRNGASVLVEYDKLSDEILVALLDYGIGQKVRDSASAASTRAKETGTDVQVEAQAMMDAAVKSLVAGEWSHRGEGSGVDPRTSVARSIVRKAIKEKVGSKSPDWAKFTGLSDADQLAKLDETYEANKEVFDPAIDAEIKRRSDAAKAKSKLASGMTVNL